MLPAGLMWGRSTDAGGLSAAAGSYAAAAAMSPAAAAAPQQLVYYFAPPSAVSAGQTVDGYALAAAAASGGGVSLTTAYQIQQLQYQQYQQQQQQQQQMKQLLAARSYQQQQQQQAQFYQVAAAAAAPLAMQSPSIVPYQSLSLSPAAMAATGGLPAGFQYHTTAAGSTVVPSPTTRLTPTLAAAAGAYLPAEQYYIPTAAAAAAVSAQTGNNNAALSSSRKRGSDELLTLNGDNSNQSSTSADMNNDAKKARLDVTAMARPSQVLHFRGVPSDVTDSEILQLSLPFGNVTNLVVSKKKNQALVEMADVMSARSAINFYSQRSPLLRGHVIHVQFSNHDRLIPDESVLQDGDGTDSQSAFNATTDEPRTVLRVVVENMVYAVTLDTLRQLFSQYGQVLKIVTFTKNGMLHALIQFADATAAQAAKMGLNGKTIYNGCNLLRVDFSKLSELSVRFNNDKTHDYTNPLLPSGETQSTAAAAAAAAAVDQQSAALALAQQSQLSAAMFGGYGPLLAYSPGAPPGTVMPSGTILLAAPPGATGANGCTVLLVSNLNEENVTPDALFTLFGVYGDVLRVKIMFNKKDTALVQFSDAGQAQIAMSNLDKLMLWSKQIKVTPSKHNVVQMPKEGQPDAGLTKDYTNSPLHRFKKPNSKNYHNIFPPSATLHLSNIPGTSKERLTELFKDFGTIVGFKFFQKDCKMALLQMSTIEEATEALIAMHNFQLAETSHLRVSFSKSSVIPPTPQPQQQQQQQQQEQQQLQELPPSPEQPPMLLLQ